MATETSPAALPATDDIAALVALHTELSVEDAGTNCEVAISENCGRKLVVYWDTEDDEAGWSWRTTEDGDYGSGALDSARELAGLIDWVTSAP